MSSGWSWPVEPLRSTDEFGYRIHPIYNVPRLHRGIDLSAYKNQRVGGAAIGVVTWAGYNGGEGNSVHVRHPDGTKTKYFHNTSIQVSVGQTVYENQQIASAGTTGDSTGVHVHFETHTNANSDSPVNPRDFMAERGAPFGSAPASGGGSTPINPEGDDELMANLSDDVKRDIEDIARDQGRKLLREDGDYRNAFKALVSEALADEVADIKGTVDNTIKANFWREGSGRERLFRVKGRETIWSVDRTDGSFTQYGSMAELMEDVNKGLVASIVVNGVRQPEPQIEYDTVEELNEMIESRKPSDNVAH